MIDVFLSTKCKKIAPLIEILEKRGYKVEKINSYLIRTDASFRVMQRLVSEFPCIQSYSNLERRKK